MARKLGQFHIDSLMHPTLKASIVLKNFKHIKSAIADTHPELLDVGVDGILMDLGMSSMQVNCDFTKQTDCVSFVLLLTSCKNFIWQVNNPERGFSVLQEGPLDMRMDPQVSRTNLHASESLGVFATSFF